MSKLTDRASGALAKVADAEAATVMQAHMKTDMAFYGVKRPQRLPIEKALAKEFPADSAREYRANVASLWALPHREERYLALSYARAFRRFIDLPQPDLYQRLVREGAHPQNMDRR